MIERSTADSTDGVVVALWDHAPRSASMPLLLAHATGFHGRVWDPMATEMSATWHPYSLDFRGHGDTPPGEGPLEWDDFVDDALAAVDAFDLRRACAIGHSMGGATLLAAELRRPGTFRSIVVYEPVLMPPEAPSGGGSFLAEMTLRRRKDFNSFEHARANFASKPPMNRFRADVLSAYVDHALRTNADGTVTLKCRPEFESAVYATEKTDIWSRLGEIRCPVLVVGGTTAGSDPLPRMVPRIAEQLPLGEATSVPEFDHFGPLTHPREFAALAAAFLTREGH